MQARGPVQAAPLPVRFMAVVFVGVTGTLTLGLVLGLPLAVFLLTAPLLVLTYRYAGDQAAKDFGPLGTSRTIAHDDDDEDPAASFADHFLAKEFGAARRGRNVALVMFGFKDFEEFGQREGSDVAGEALREFGHLLRKLTRQMNLSARYGWRADTFLSVLSDADARAAERFIARVREAVAASKVKMPPIDAGLAVYQPHLASPDEFVECAERALAAARADVHDATFSCAVAEAPRRQGNGPTMDSPSRFMTGRRAATPGRAKMAKPSS
jgi:diguanylate cyclase (GGDEF)-like protein